MIPPRNLIDVTQPFIREEGRERNHNTCLPEWVLLIASGYRPDESSDRAETLAKNSPDQEKEETSWNSIGQGTLYASVIIA